MKKVITLLVLAVFIAVMLMPVWRVQIKGSDDAYELWVWVQAPLGENRAPEIIDYALFVSTKGTYLREDGLIESWEFVPNAIEFVTDENRLTWSELNDELWNYIQVNGPLLLEGKSNGVGTSAEIKVIETLYQDDRPVSSHETSISVFGTPYALRTIDADQTIYAGLSVKLQPRWLNERQSLARILQSAIFGESFTAEEICKISLLG